MHSNAALITTFYKSLDERDGGAMAACYAPDIVFSDMVFPRLEGLRAGAMWQMLTERSRDLAVTTTGIEADDERGRARWTAQYTFSKTGRTVVNVIDATFVFRDRLIVRHDDRFDFWRWSRQALGPVGIILGWSPLLRGKVQREAEAGLDAYIKKNNLEAVATH